MWPFQDVPSTDLKDSGNEQDARPIEFGKLVEFDRELHFLTPDGRDTVIQPGGYSVEAVPEGLQLQSADHETAGGSDRSSRILYA